MALLKEIVCREDIGGERERGETMKKKRKNPSRQLIWRERKK